MSEGKQPKLRPYMCKFFKWTSWRHYDQRMPETACKFKDYEMGSCKGICDKFKIRKEYEE